MCKETVLGTRTMGRGPCGKCRTTPAQVRSQRMFRRLGKDGGPIVLGTAPRDVDEEAEVECIMSCSFLRRGRAKDDCF